MTGRLEGRSALVAGAARGIGAAVAERFAEEGAWVAIADTLVDDGRATAGRLDGVFVEADVSDPAGAEQAVAAAVEAHGGLDILVQNAGIYPWTLIEKTSAEEWDRVMAVNLRGTFLAAKAALPHMRRAGGGRMIFKIRGRSRSCSQPS